MYRLQDCRCQDLRLTQIFSCMGTQLLSTTVRTWLGYGELTSDQVVNALESNKRLKSVLKVQMGSAKKRKV